MNKRILALACATCFVLSPFGQHQIYGLDVNISHDTMMKTDQMKSDESMKTDEALAKSVKDAIAADKDLANVAQNVDVKAANGVVTLSGKVDSDKVKSDIEAKAKAVSGVTKVDNQLEVKSSAF